MAGERLSDKVAVIVGGTSGIGKGCAALLASRGVRVTVVGRSKEKTEGVVKETGAADYLLVDVSKQASVLGLADELRSKFTHINYLVLTAAALYDQRKLSEDGVEMSLVMNYLWRFQLVNSIKDLLLAAPQGARVLNVAGAGINGDVFFDDPNLEHEKFTTLKAAWQAQQLNDVMTVESQRRWGSKGNGVQFHVVFPGQVNTSKTGLNNFIGILFDYILVPFKKSIEASAKQLTPLLLDPVGAQGGKLWSASSSSGPVTEIKPSARVLDPEYAMKCWMLSESLLKVKG